MTYSKKYLINYCTKLLKKQKIKNPRYESILILSQILNESYKMRIDSRQFTEGY